MTDFRQLQDAAGGVRACALTRGGRRRARACSRR
jgi:hypothetical protein